MFILAGRRSSPRLRVSARRRLSRGRALLVVDVRGYEAVVVRAGGLRLVGILGGDAAKVRSYSLCFV